MDARCLSHTWVMIMGKRAYFVSCVIRCCCHGEALICFSASHKLGFLSSKNAFWEIFSSCFWKTGSNVTDVFLFLFIPVCTDKITFNMLLWAMHPLMHRKLQTDRLSRALTWVLCLIVWEKNILHSLELNSLMYRSSEWRLDGYCVDSLVLLHLLT